MQIFVKNLNGRTITIESGKNETVQNLKEKIESKEGIPACMQNLVNAGKQLNDKKLLGEYDIEGGSMIELFLASNSNRKRSLETISFYIPPITKRFGSQSDQSTPIQSESSFWNHQGNRIKKEQQNTNLFSPLVVIQSPSSN